MTRKQVLFVDDEPKILKALRRILYPVQKEWDFYFAESAAEAMLILDRQRINVLVTDMQMPGMNGLELLKESRRLYPSVVRVMLTGQPSKELFCEVLTVCHYFFWKPVNNQELINLLGGIADLDNSLQDERLLALIGGMTSLPSLPLLYTRLTDLLQSDQSDIAQVAEVVNEDVSMAAQVLKLVNSAYFGISRQFSSLQEAVAYLGLDILRQLVLVHHLFSECTSSAICKFHLEELWNHSLCTARLAKVIAESKGHSPQLGQTAYMAGLLHDLGKLVLIRHLPEIYAAVLARCGHGHCQIDCEEELLGTNHASIGGYLSSLWGLPHTVTQVLTFHHHDMTTEERVRLYPVSEVVWHADRLCNNDGARSENYRHLLENLAIPVRSS